MIKFIQAFLTGVFFTFILDFFLFLGVKFHYIDYYLETYLNADTSLYYNIVFADNQCIVIYLILTVLIGYLTTYCRYSKQALVSMVVLFLLSISTLIPPIGNMVGHILFKQENKVLNDGRFSYTGDIMYESRHFTYIFDQEENRIFQLNNKDLKQ